MSLPNPGMDAIPLTPLKAEFLDKMIENIESLSDGSGISNNAIDTAQIKDGAITSDKIDWATLPEGAIPGDSLDWTSAWGSGRYLNNTSLGGTKKTITLYGWGYGRAASGGSTISKAVSFGMTFKTPPVAIAQILGYKSGSGSAPAGPTDHSGVAGEVVRGGQATTTTQTTIYITSATGGSINPNTYILFNLIVIGEPT